MIAVLYQGCRLTPDKNFIVDNIETYLSTIPSGQVHTITDLNYFKQELETSIKLDLNQTYLDMNSKYYNYCKITNSSGVPCYYFITGLKWRSKTVIEFMLTMDSVSTIGLLKLTAKTLIHREHRDRFYLTGSHIAPLVDKVAEGITPVLHKINEAALVYKSGMKWYSIFETDNDVDPTEYNQVNPLKMYFAPEDTTLTMYSSIDPKILDLTFFSSPTTKYTISSLTLRTKRVQIKINGNYYIIDYGTYIDSIRYGYLRVEQYDPYTLTCYLVRTSIEPDGTETTTVYATETTTQIEISDCPSYFGYHTEVGAWPTTMPKEANRYETFTDNDRAIKGLDGIDLTSSKLVKIIELPYPPFDLEGDEFFTPKYNLYETNSGLITLRNKDDFPIIKFEDEFSGNFFTYAKECLRVDSRTLKRSDLYDAMNESKLLNSEFYSPKFIYDSFGYPFAFEDIYLYGFYWSRFNMIFKVSKDISSSFLFDFSKHIKFRSDTKDYTAILPIKRNNEVALYNNQYLNYIRNGYNYDVKAKNREETSRDISLGLQMAQAGAVGAISIASANPAAAITGVIHSVTSITNAVISNINQATASTNALEHKIASLKAQKTDFNNIDDLSLLNYYTNQNKAKIVEYTPSELMKNNLLKTFHYSGYNSEYLGIPDLFSRNRFNYLKAEIDLDDSTVSFLTRNYNQEIIADYRARFSNGITLIHKYNNEYDFDQKYENWEVILESYLI